MYSLSNRLTMVKSSLVYTLEVACFSLVSSTTVKLACWAMVRTSKHPTNQTKYMYEFGTLTIYHHNDVHLNYSTQDLHVVLTHLTYEGHSGI